MQGTSPSLPLDRYAGKYLDPLRGEIVVSADAGGLKVRYSNAFVGRLKHWHHNTFRAVWEADWRGPALINFTLGPSDGAPAAIEYQEGRFVRVVDAAR